MLIGLSIVNLCTREGLQSYCKIWPGRSDEYPMEISLAQTSDDPLSSFILGQMKIHRLCNHKKHLNFFPQEVPAK